MRLLLIGFGTVGQGLAEILRDKATDLQHHDQFVPSVVGVATRSRGSLYHPDGLDIDALLEAAAGGHFDSYPAADGLARGLTPLELIEKADADVMVESTWSDFETAQPALDHCLSAFSAGQHVVLANKGPVALAYRKLKAAAETAQRALRFEGTVMAGTPAVAMALETLAGCKIKEARGILNGTTNYILTQMENGMTYADALAKAQQLGYAEADPTADVGGWDAAGKVLILASALYDAQWTMDQLDVTGITEITSEQIQAARAANERYKLIATVTPEGGSVRPVRLPMSDPLAAVNDATNAVTYSTDLTGDITVIGAGAGRRETGFALLADLLAIHRLYS